MILDLGRVGALEFQALGFRSLGQGKMEHQMEHYMPTGLYRENLKSTALRNSII